MQQAEILWLQVFTVLAKADPEVHGKEPMRQSGKVQIEQALR
jgi:hypothetical protein